MESWRKVFREALAPQLSTPGLEALRMAMATDDARLLQGATCMPPPLNCTQDCPVEGACGIGYCAWQGDGVATVGEVEQFFSRICNEVDQHFGEPTACRWSLSFFDETPRYEMIRLLLPEVELALASRQDRKHGEAASA